MLMDVETGREEIKKEKQPKQKKIKDHNKTDRLIARMILGIGLSLTIANAIACGFIHSKFSNVKDEYFDATNAKAAYLDTFEQSDEFKTTYNKDVNTLNNRLIAREIDAYTYESELEKLNNNEYTEKVLVENADNQTKAEFDEINKKYLDTSAEWDKQAMPSAIASLSAFAMPITTLGLYCIWKPRKKYNDLEVDFEHHISEEAFKRVMKLKDLPPYHPINASENQICKDMLKNVTHNDDTQQNCGYSHLIHTEEETQENQNTL